MPLAFFQFLERAAFDIRQIDKLAQHFGKTTTGHAFASPPPHTVKQCRDINALKSIKPCKMPGACLGAASSPGSAPGTGNGRDRPESGAGKEGRAVRSGATRKRS
jgi:hypothetical protein